MLRYVFRFGSSNGCWDVLFITVLGNIFTILNSWFFLFSQHVYSIFSSRMHIFHYTQESLFHKYGSCYHFPIVLDLMTCFLFNLLEKQRSEDHHLYKLSYMHLGSTKVWYGIPGRYSFKLVEVVKKLFPQLPNHPKLFHELVSNILLL